MRVMLGKILLVEGQGGLNEYTYNPIEAIQSNPAIPMLEHLLSRREPSSRSFCVEGLVLEVQVIKWSSQMVKTCL